MFGNAGMSPSKGIRDTRMRMGRGMDDEDDDDEHEDDQDDDQDGPREAVAQPSFKKDDISLDQVCSSAVYVAAWSASLCSCCKKHVGTVSECMSLGSGSGRRCERL